MRKSKTRTTSKKQRPSKARFASQKQPLIEHVYELRRRIFYVAACIAAGSMVAYGIQQKVVAVLLRPSHGQNFIYTSPLGGINFLFSVCLDIGVVVSLPVIIYHLLRFIEPLMKATTTRFIMLGSIVSGLVAIGGVAFGYFLGLPAALHFLLHQFTSAQIRPLVTVQAYLSFVTIYLLGSALMFQLPLVLIFINRIKPLKPGGLFHYERHVIVAAVIIGFIMNPTPNILDQMIVVLPIILMYQLGIALIWFVNRRAAPVKTLLERDSEFQAKRLQLASQLKPLESPPVVVPVPKQPAVPVTQATVTSPGRVRPRKYVDDFVRRPSVLPATQSEQPTA